MQELTNEYSVTRNRKKSIRLQNNARYFIPDKDRHYNTFSSPDSYQAKVMKQEGYENRLYWEYRYCEDNDGQTFFFTLTYCDDKVPKYFGKNCFDYEDLVWLLNGGFKKKLLRSYGTNFKYFVGAELGEGKGKRGFENNPHYHILFFLRPDSSGKYLYKKIDADEFRHLLREYWQGFDEDVDGFHDYRTCKYGIVKEGKFGAKVQNFRALTYCSKYVTKDLRLKKRELKIRNILMKRYSQKYNINNPECIKEFFRVDYPQYFVEFPFEGSAFEMQMDLENLKLKDKFFEHCNKCINALVDFDINVYRNRYCNKCRISQGVGDYALQFITDELNPTINVYTKSGCKTRPINLYYYRKLFTDVIYDNGIPLRVLNHKGIEYKCNRIKSQVKRLSDETFANVKSLDRCLYDKILASDVNEDVRMSYDSFMAEIRRYSDVQLKDICNRYAEFKLVYEDRFTTFLYDRSIRVVEFPNVDLLVDYRRFLRPSIFAPEFNPCSADYLKRVDSEGLLSYMAHPYFREFRCLFDVFSLISDYLFVKTDDKKENDAEKIKAVAEFHKLMQVKSYFVRKCS